MARKAHLISLITSEMKEVERGTSEYYKLVQEGWLSQEQLSHRKAQEIYPEDYQPDFIEEPEEDNTDYPTTEIRDIIENRIIEMYDTILNVLGDIPIEKQVYSRGIKRVVIMDLSESKEELLNMLDDLYAQSEDEDTVNQYLLENESKIAELTIAVINDSEAEQVEYHLSLLALALNGGNPLSMEQAKRIAEEIDKGLANTRARQSQKLYKREMEQQRMR